MVTKVVDDESVHQDYLRTRRAWKAGKGKNWFYPSANGAHVRLFWDKTRMPCLEYFDGGSNTTSMVRAARKLENYAYGIEQLKGKLGDDFYQKVVNEIVVTMRNWPSSSPSKPVVRLMAESEEDLSEG